MSPTMCIVDFCNIFRATAHVIIKSFETRETLYEGMTLYAIHDDAYDNSFDPDPTSIPLAEAKELFVVPFTANSGSVLERTHLPTIYVTKNKQLETCPAIDLNYQTIYRETPNDKFDDFDY